ncbi:MAG: alcohol dehydrogenase catalytic domain-containing protein [Thermodesulfobacteriota bacterium]
MKVAKWYNNKDIRIEEVPVPVPGDNEILVKVVSCGICGSDIVEWYRLPRAPLVPGHEIGGEVAAAGKAVGRFKPGDRVFVAPKVSCMACYYCKKGHYPVCSNVRDRLPGGFAEYVLIPPYLVQEGTYLLPDSMTYDQSTFIEPLACVVRAQRLADLQAGQALLVMGCGMSGLLHIKLAKTMNCTIVATDSNKKRLKFAQKSGADLTIDASDNVPDLLAAQNKKMADVVMLCTSSLAAVEQAWKCVDKGGAVVFFAVPDPGKNVIVPINEFWMKEIRILTSYYCGPDDISRAIGLLSSGRIVVDDMITHILPLTDIVKGYRLVADGDMSIKVIIKP